RAGGARLPLRHAGRRPRGRAAEGDPARPQAAEGRRARGAARDPGRRQAPDAPGRDPHLLARGARHRRELQPRRQQLHREADRVRQVPRDRRDARTLLAVAERAAAARRGRELVTDPAAPRPLSLLLIEDSETDAELVVLELRRHGFRVESGRVDAEAELREALRAGSWDLVLCDHNLPSFDSTAALRTLQDAGADVPFVVFSGTIGEEAAVEMLKAGARDVVLKTNLARLGPVVERVLEEAAERRRRSEAEEERARLEEMLRQSQKMEAIGSLAGGIAHDFNNVLLVVRGTCAQLLAELGDEAQRARVEEIDRAAESAADLTRQLLAFGRRQVLRPEPTDVSAVVRDTLELVGRLLGDDVELESALAPGLDNVLVDRSQLRQVVVNLVVNARDALADERRILIETANASLDESYA